jgi:hypothetical protein
LFVSEFKFCTYRNSKRVQDFQGFHIAILINHVPWIQDRCPRLVTIFEGTALISAASAILVSVFALVQLRHMEKHRNVEISMKLFEWAENDRLRKALRWVDQEFKFTSYSEESKHQTDEGLHEVVAFFEQVGFLVQKKFVDLDVVVDRLGHYIVLDWRKLEPWITATRREKSDSTYGEHFQSLYTQTMKYMRKRCVSGETNFCIETEP